jgi:chemotaxis protein methyltransferase CheR
MDTQIENGTITNFVTLTDKEYQLVRDLIYQRFGINLGDQKRSLVIGRLNKVLKQLGFDDFSGYYDYVISDTTGEALTTLVNRISTNHTFFYREADHFQYFSEKVLPEIVEKLKVQKRCDLRIWCPGCSSGEEPYTLAMLVAEYFGNQLALWDTGVLATDISLRVLEKAKAGIYTESNINNLPSGLRRKYFQQVSNDEWEISDKIKDMVLIRRLNLIRQSFPFKKQYQVIFCRNVMIYFDQPTRNTLVSQFHRYLEPGGYLFIGHSESLGRDNPYFNYIKPAIYRKEI